MSAARDLRNTTDKRAPGPAIEPAEAPAGTGAPEAVGLDVLPPDEDRKAETFIPVTRFALIDRLTRPSAWAPGEAKEARRFFEYLSHWRHQQYMAGVLDLERTYEPFNPDSDLLRTRAFTDGERAVMQKRLVAHVKEMLTQANYVAVDPSEIEIILTRESHYGLDLQVDLGAFEELLIFYRGASSRRDEKRNWKKFLRKEEFDVPIFQRLFLLFKLKPFEMRVEELLRDTRLTRKEAEKRVRRLRALVPGEVKEENVYIKMFKNLPRSDIEMVFPNTRVKFRMWDKVKLGVTGGAGLGMGAVGAAGKIALVASNPVAAAGAVAALGGIAFRQFMNFSNTRQRYMVIMAQNLYFHALADNRGALIKLADRAAEEDVKEEMLLYAVLAKAQVLKSELDSVDRAVEKYLLSSFDVRVDFDLKDALGRLMREGLVREARDGMLVTLSPVEAAHLIDGKWDRFLDDLAHRAEEGTEIADQSQAPGRT